MGWNRCHACMAAALLLQLLSVQCRRQLSVRPCVPQLCPSKSLLILCWYLKQLFACMREAPAAMHAHMECSQWQ